MGWQLSRRRPTGKGAIRSTFAAAEGLFRLMLEKSPRLTAVEGDTDFITRIEAGCAAAWDDVAPIADVIGAASSGAVSGTPSTAVTLAASLATMPDLRGNQTVASVLSPLPFLDRGVGSPMAGRSRGPLRNGGSFLTYNSTALPEGHAPAGHRSD